MIDNLYWGPEYSDGEILKTLKKNGIQNYSYHKNIEEYTAKHLKAGKLVGWFQGGMEFGQRALGNRSIIADPTDPGVKDKITGIDQTIVQNSSFQED